VIGDPQVIYSSIIKGFAQAKQAEKCFRTLEEMEAQGRALRWERFV
jgi:pentatricopeptide repeat protein